MTNDKGVFKRSEMGGTVNGRLPFEICQSRVLSGILGLGNSGESFGLTPADVVRLFPYFFMTAVIAGNSS